MLSTQSIWPPQLRMKERIPNLAKLGFHMHEGGKVLAQNHNRESCQSWNSSPGLSDMRALPLGSLPPGGKLPRLAGSELQLRSRQQPGFECLGKEVGFVLRAPGSHMEGF